MAEIKITINNAECNNDVNYVFMSQISIPFNKLCVHQLHHYLLKQNTQIKKNSYGSLYMKVRIQLKP